MRFLQVFDDGISVFVGLSLAAKVAGEELDAMLVSRCRFGDRVGFECIPFLAQECQRQLSGPCWRVHVDPCAATS